MLSRPRLLPVLAALTLACAPAAFAQDGVHLDDPDPSAAVQSAECANADTDMSELSAAQVKQAVSCLIGAARAEKGLSATPSTAKARGFATKRVNREARCMSKAQCRKSVKVPGRNQWVTAYLKAESTPSDAVFLWLNVPKFSKALLSPDWTESGIAAKDTVISGTPHRLVVYQVLVP